MTEIHQVSTPQRAWDWFRGSSPFSLLLKFGLCVIAFYIFFSTEAYNTYVFEPVVHVNAVLASKFLNLVGFETVTSGTIISGHGFSVSISVGCDGIEPTFLFITAVLIFPMLWSKKIIGILVGTFFLMTLNLVRIISLFWAGIYNQRLFDILHVEVWQFLFIIAALFTWLVWAQWALKSTRNAGEIKDDASPEASA